MEKVPEPKIELPQKPPQEFEIQRWEDEGGRVETPEEKQTPETVAEELKVKKSWQELIIQARQEFPEEIKAIVDKMSRKEKLTSKETGVLDVFSFRWFREAFGIKIKKKSPQQKPTKKVEKQLTEEEIIEQKRQVNEIKRLNDERRKQYEDIKRTKLTELYNLKIVRMEKLHEALRNLDDGEPVEEFKDESRKVIYFKETTGEYFTEQGKVVTIGDVMSDYAWGIKYAPDGEMTEPAYRTLAKKILVNETRRELERIHNSELIHQRSHRSSADSFNRQWPRFKEVFKGSDKEIVEKKLEEIIGWIIEVATRELLSRISLNTNINLVVSRATVEEDADYKYDFKIRVKHHTRGVDVQSKNINSIGFQLKSRIKRGSAGLGKQLIRSGTEVDEIITLNVPGKEFREVIKKWLNAGEPSGGPEQFLSRKLKIEILKAVTKNLTKISDEDIDIIFPKEKA